MSDEYLKPSELGILAVKIVEETLGRLSPFDKNEVLAVANVLINVQITREMNKRKTSQK